MPRAHKQESHGEMTHAVGFAYCPVCGWSRSCVTVAEAQDAAAVHHLRHAPRPTPRPTWQ